MQLASQTKDKYCMCCHFWWPSTSLFEKTLNTFSNDCIWFC